MPPASPRVQYLTPGQAASILGVSPKTINRWTKEGRLPCVTTLGGHRRFRADVIHAAAASMGLEEDVDESSQSS